MFIFLQNRGLPARATQSITKMLIRALVLTLTPAAALLAPATQSAAVPRPEPQAAAVPRPEPQAALRPEEVAFLDAITCDARDLR